MKQTFHKVLTLSFLTYIGGFFMLQFITPTKTFSELENRNLATLPDFTMESFLEGSYGSAFEKYIADQFPGRNSFIAMKSASEMLLQKTENNGVYIGDNGHFFQKFETPDEELMLKNQDYISSLAKEKNLYFLLAPTATKVYEEWLPKFATPYDEKAYIDTFSQGLDDSVHIVEAYEKLTAHKDEGLYYKTDHHWTTLGAYYAYDAFCESYGIETLPLESFTRETVTDSFYGSLFSKGNFVFAKPDNMELFYPKEENPLSVYYVADDRTETSLYEMSHLEKKDKYSVFLDNNHPMIKINTNIKNGKKLAIIKDSYANAVVPFLANHFEEIHILDLRFLNLSIPDYMTQEGIEDILMIYNVQNFSKENKFSLLVPRS